MHFNEPYNTPGPEPVIKRFLKTLSDIKPKFFIFRSKLLILSSVLRTYFPIRVTIGSNFVASHITVVTDCTYLVLSIRIMPLTLSGLHTTTSLFDASFFSTDKSSLEKNAEKTLKV